MNAVCEYDGRPCFVGVAPNDIHTRCGTTTCLYGAEALRARLAKLRKQARGDLVDPLEQVKL